MENRESLDLKALRERLTQAQGKEYWRSLEELADTKEFQKFLDDEFPNRSSLLQMDRRQFMLLMGASLAMAGLSGCRFQPQTRIVPYVKQPEDLVLGKPLFYTSAYPFNGDTIGLIVTSREGRPVKIEGNPDHPSSLGSTDVFTQASILDLYDPDRSQVVLNQGEGSTWGAFLDIARAAMEKQRAGGGAGLRVLTETVSSPTLAAQIQTLQKQFPSAKWHQYEPVNRDNVHAGAQIAFGEVVHTLYQFDKADRIVSLDGDFLLTMPGHVRYSRQFSTGRRVRHDKTEMNRLYVVESTPTITGAMADHRVPVKPSEVEGIARALASKLGVAEAGGGNAPAWMDALVADLQASKGKSVIVVGDHLPPAVHALGHAMNQALGNVGQTVVYTDPVETNPVNQTDSLRELIADMQAGKVELLLIVGGNPVYNAPADLAFADQLTKVPLRVHLSAYNDETSALCQWQVPLAHYLESWGDARAIDGTISIIQPLIEPLYEAAKSPAEFLAALMNQPGSGYDIVSGYWRTKHTGPDFDAYWEKILRDGLVAGTTLPTRTVTLKSGGLPAPSAPVSGLEISFRPDPTIWDGRYNNNGWLQELHKPLTKIVWDNAAFVSPATAGKLGLDTDNLVELKLNGRSVTAAVWMQPGHPDDTISLHLGYGRGRTGHVGANTGFNANLIRTADAPWFAGGLQASKAGGSYHLVSTQHHHSMEERAPIRVVDIEEFRNPPAKKEGEEEESGFQAGIEKPISLYDNGDHHYEGFGAYAWGMSIDTNVCIGCNACAIACQSENNISIVGKDEVDRGREMHWLRIDRYYKIRDHGKPRDVKEEFPQELDSGLFNSANVETFFQPVLCMHCEQAPCEPVCPVAATVHSHEGLNQMVYNRCVGTKYCSNNCPYKVRRFNFYKYAAGQPAAAPGNFDVPTIQLVANPEVTVRGRGVMEKCSYCVQRINNTRIEAKKAGREIGGDEVVTACQQVCPTQAIVFGNIADKNSQAYKLKQEDRLNYSLLGELGTRPRTTYLAKLQNTNPQVREG